MINIGMTESSKSSLTNVQSGDIQPNGVDLRVGKIFYIYTDTFTLDEDIKVHRGSVEMQPDPDGYLELCKGSYEVIMQNNISVAEGEAGFVISRSTLIRNGVFLTSGLYDSGYNGAMACVMHVRVGSMRIKPGTRIGQYISFKAETSHRYDGSYGIGSSHDAKYGV
jgi:dCTP deaminase/dUTP pyrophosphatase